MDSNLTRKPWGGNQRCYNHCNSRLSVAQIAIRTLVGKLLHRGWNDLKAPTMTAADCLIKEVYNLIRVVQWPVGTAPILQGHQSMEKEIWGAVQKADCSCWNGLQSYFGDQHNVWISMVPPGYVSNYKWLVESLRCFVTAEMLAFQMCLK